MKKIKANKIYLYYFLIFLLLSSIVFSIFSINKKTFIWQADGLKQHFIILIRIN